MESVCRGNSTEGSNPSLSANPVLALTPHRPILRGAVPVRFASRATHAGFAAPAAQKPRCELRALEQPRCARARAGDDRAAGGHWDQDDRVRCAVILASPTGMRAGPSQGDPVVPEHSSYSSSLTAIRTERPQQLGWLVGGEKGIRTLGTVSRTHAFQACSLNHSDTSPGRRGL